jgi:hypothetical protein
MIVFIVSTVIILLIPPFILFYIFMMPLLLFKKKLNFNGRRRWAFFHPFWYNNFNQVTMVEGVRKFYGA